MAHYQVTIAYDGTGFWGFQRQNAEGEQPNPLTGRTVQGEIETALRCLGWPGGTIRPAGRTDTGVHASGQVIDFFLEWRHSPQALCRALNANLPADVSAQAVRLAPPEFHPRYSAFARRYRYTLYCQPDRHALRERYNWRVWPAVNPALADAAAQHLLGTHDFAAFGTPPRPGGSTVRTVWQAAWSVAEQGLHFEIIANAFLYHMVRRLVFVQVLIGQERLSLEALQDSLVSGRKLPSGLAAPQGLVFCEAYYGLTGE